MPKSKQTKEVKVKGWGIINDETEYLWGVGGTTAHPIQVFSTQVRAVFNMKLQEHEQEYERGRTKIIPVTISYRITKK